MGGTLAPKSFPWPSTIGGSPAAPPLNRATAPTLAGPTSPYGGTSEPNLPSASVPSSPTTPPIVRPPLLHAPLNPFGGGSFSDRPMPSPLLGGPHRASAFYG